MNGAIKERTQVRDADRASLPLNSQDSRRKTFYHDLTLSHLRVFILQVKGVMA